MNTVTKDNQVCAALPLGPVMLDVVGASLTEGDIKRLMHPAVGAVILFARNYENKQQVSDLISSIKALRSPSLLIAVDQEGGRVQRFKEGFTALPAVSTFGEMWDADKQTAPMKAFESARVMAGELIEVGVDFSFAPVFDVATTESDVIGDRSFHTLPNAASELLGAYIDGMHAEGMVAIAKHFPGHGGVSGDSHHCLPEDTRGIDEILSCDLLPYKALVDDIQGVMTAHVLFKQCDVEIPTFSRFWIKEMLRDDLGFNGVVFSDDLTMAGAEELTQSNIVDSAKRAIKAGCDMVLVCNSPEKADQLLDGLPYEADDRLSYRLNQLRAQ